MNKLIAKGIAYYCELYSELMLAILVSLFIVIALFIVIKSIKGSVSFSVLSYLIGVLLFALLTYQIRLFFPAVNLYDYSDIGSQTLNIIARFVQVPVDKIIGKPINDAITWFIIRRVLYCLVFVTGAFFGISMTSETAARNPRRRSRSVRRDRNKSYDDSF